MTLDEFFLAVDNDDLEIIDRAVYILWYLGREENNSSTLVGDLATVIERHGYSRPNVTRLTNALIADRRVVRDKQGWKLSPRSRRDLDVDFAPVLNERKTLAPSDSVLPRELFHGTRTYIEKVVYQINASYDVGLFDCCAVMCRRLLETLIIEVYETLGRANEIKSSTGNFFMFADLLAFLDKDPSLHPSRNAKTALKDFKRLGDLSAHNRRHNAVKDDIDRVRDGIRVAAGELLVMAHLVKAPTAA